MRSALLLSRRASCNFFSLRTKATGGAAAPTMTVSKAQDARTGAPQGQLVVQPDQYPQVRRDESVVEDLHGTKVADPYRWLEDPDSEETRKFVEAENQVTQSVLDQCDTRDAFKQLFTQLYDYPKYGTPFKRGSRYFYYFNSGLQQQSVLFSMSSLSSEPRLLLDPNTLSADGTVALTGAAFSDDGTMMAYSLSAAGSDWNTIQVLTVGAEGEAVFHQDKLEYVKFSSMAWTHDNKGFFYNRYAKPAVDDLGTETDSATNQLLCYHVLGTPQEQDVVVYAMPDQPQWMCGAEVSDDGRYLLLYVREGCLPTNRLFYVDLAAVPKDAATGGLDFSKFDFEKGADKLPVVKLVDNFEASYDYVANEGDTFYFMTNLDAPRYRVVSTQLSGGPTTSAAAAPAWKDILPQHPKDLLKSAVALKGDFLLARYLKDVAGTLQLHQLSSGQLLQDVPMPVLGSVGVSGDRKNTEFFFSLASFVVPGSIYRMDVADASPAPTLHRTTELKVPHSAEDYEVKQVFVTSKDGTKVPMFITHRKGLTLDGSTPTLLYGYGGFNVSLEPAFSASRLTWLRGYGGVFAQTNIRGGGEYGIDWRNAGSKANKQNVFDDFQACAEFLQKEGYCSPSTLAIQGGSNGGLLVAACVNQRPDLYAAGIAQVGVMDMLRFHKFTIGHAWKTDYGDPDQAADFAYIHPYSPLHHVAPPPGGSGQYPAMILATGDHDDRVVPLHSFKLIAELQHALALAPGAASKQRNPLVIRIEVRAGHGAGKPTTKIIQETSDLMAFAAKCMGAKWMEAKL